MSKIFRLYSMLYRKRSQNKSMAVITPEQKTKGKEVLPPLPSAKIMVPQSFSNLKIIKWGRSGEGLEKHGSPRRTKRRIDKTLLMM